LAKRSNGEGTWGKKIIGGIEYFRFRKKYEGVGFKDFYGKKKKEVQDKIDAYESDYNKIKKDIFKPKTFSELLSDWMYEIKFKSKSRPLARKTIDETINVYNSRILNSCLKNVQIGQITPQVCDEYITEMIEREYSKASIDKALMLIRQYLTYAYSIKLTSNNLSIYFKSPSEKAVQTKKRESSILSAEDMEKLYFEAKRISEEGFTFGKKIGTRVYENNGYAIIFIMYTGLRVGEFLELRWKDFNIKEKYVVVSRSVSRVNKIGSSGKEDVVKEPKTENGKRVIPLCDRALECVHFFDRINPTHCQEDLFAVSSVGTRMNKDNLRRSLNTMLVRSKCSIKECGLHTLRHSFGSYLLLEDGNDIAVVSSLLGHSKISTTYDIYIHVLDEQKIKNLKIFNQNKTLKLEGV